jgi:hypothetical protein
MASTKRPVLNAPADVLERVRAEYREMPGLKVTPSQARRLFGVEPSMCAALLDALTNEHFLVRTADGQFVQSGRGPKRELREASRLS